MTVLAIIPARIGSVRLPKKNLRLLAGKPVLHYPIRAALESSLFNDVLVSTDSPEIEEAAIRSGAHIWKRAPDDGTRGTQEVAAEVLRRIGTATIACVIYPTAALLSSEDLQAGFTLLTRRRGSWHPHFVMAVGTDPLRDAGAMYWGYAQAFRDGKALLNGRTLMYALPEERVVDVNTAEDFAELERKFEAMRAPA